MASQSNTHGAPKLCPRCGAFYQDLSSKTCPQCFAKLTLLDDEAAAELIAEQERRASDPDILAQRSADDEKFKEQAFGACLSVVGIAVLTVIVCAVMIVVGAKHYHGNVQVQPSKPIETSIGSAVSSLSYQELPETLIGFSRTEIDNDMALPGSVARVAHAQYGSGLQVYAVPSEGLSDDQLSSLRLAVSFAANQHQPPATVIDLPTQATHFEVLADSSEIAGKASTQLQHE
jgi:hypothetical protein